MPENIARDFLNFAKLCLDDDNGISNEAYDCLVDAAEQNKMVDLRDLLFHVNATDGRFYLPSDDLAADEGASG